MILSTRTRKDNNGLDPSLAVAIKEELAKSESSWRMTGHPLVFVGTTSEVERVPTRILDCFKHVVEFEVWRHVPI